MANNNSDWQDVPLDDWQDIPTGPKKGAGMAALEGAGQGLTFGYLPHIQAAVEPAFTGVMNALTGSNVEVDGDYVSRRDANIKRMEQQAKDHPAAAVGGKVAGALVGGVATYPLMPLKGLMAAKAAKDAGMIGRAAALGTRTVGAAGQGAVIGAVQNPGDTEGEISPLQIDQRAGNAALGAVVGAATNPAVEGVAKVAKQVPVAAKRASEWLGKTAAKKATRSLGRPTPTMAAKMEKSGRDVELGRMLLDEGAVPIVSTTDKMTKNVSELKGEIGERIGSLIDEGAAAGSTIDAEKLAVEILDSPKLAQMRKTPGMESTVSAIESQIETLAQNKTIGLKEAHKLRQSIDEAINYNKANQAAKGGEVGLKMQREALADAIAGQVDAQVPSAGANALRRENKKYSLLSDATKILDREAARNQANRSISLTDTITGAGGAAAGFLSGDSTEDRIQRAAIGASLGLANKVGRSFGSSTAARGYNALYKLTKNEALSRLLSASPEIAALVEKNPGIATKLVQEFQRPELRPMIPRPAFAKDSREPNRSPALGYEKWAQKGAAKLAIPSPLVDKLMQSKEGKQLLIEASDLDPNSPAFKRIQSKLKGWK